jgi:hypothetical protein
MDSQLLAPRSKRREADNPLDRVEVLPTPLNQPGLHESASQEAAATAPSPLLGQLAAVEDIVELVYRRLEAERPVYREGSEHPLPSYRPNHDSDTQRSSSPIHANTSLSHTHVLSKSP